MKAISCCLVLLIIVLSPLHAQPATPAQPADPNQARPAVPVDSAPVPAPPPASTSTNAPSTQAPQVTVAIIAESSLKQVLQVLAQGWADTQDSGPQVPLTLANTGTIRTKVEGAPSGSGWDLVISADVADVKEMTDQGFLFGDGQRSLARNSLVVYGRKALVKDDDLDWFDLVGTEWKKVALGNPDFVASGRVARRALQKHDLLGDDKKGLYVDAPTDALAEAVVQREEADAVFVYKTDAARMNLHGFDTFPVSTDDAPPVFYTAAVCHFAKNPAQARAFIDYCTSDAGKVIWARYGFETN